MLFRSDFHGKVATGVIAHIMHYRVIAVTNRLLRCWTRRIFVIVIAANIFTFSLRVDASGLLVKLANSSPQLGARTLRARGKDNAIARWATRNNLNAADRTGLSRWVCHRS